MIKFITETPPRYWSLSPTVNPSSPGISTFPFLVFRGLSRFFRTGCVRVEVY